MNLFKGDNALKFVIELPCFEVGGHVRQLLVKLGPPQKKALAYPMDFPIWTVGRKGEKMAVLEMMGDERVSFAVQPVDANGAPAKIEDGTLTVVSSDTTIVTVSSADGGVSGFIEATGLDHDGEAVVTVSFDADRGDGVKTISADVRFIIDSHPAVGAGITLGTPEKIPAP